MDWHDLGKSIEVRRLVITFGHKPRILEFFLNYVPDGFDWHCLYHYTQGNKNYAMGCLWPNGARAGLAEQDRAAIWNHFCIEY